MLYYILLKLIPACSKLPVSLVLCEVMMKLYVKEVAQAKGYKNAKALADAMSEHFGARISYGTIYPLWNDEAQLWSRPTFDKLCSFLNVPAGMLIQHIPGEAQTEPGPVESPSPVERKTARKLRSKGKVQAAGVAVSV
ncbi:MAG TPA: helix-turn-helix transcriptional regulator [Blastocatellia bacterium]|nr:helix-turn-helix transcriptional regulator [Blastocatellia bacterium]